MEGAGHLRFTIYAGRGLFGGRGRGGGHFPGGWSFRQN